MEVAALIGLAFMVGILIRLFAGSLDSDRIGEYIRGRGWELLDRSWDPLGPGWFGEKNARLYKVAYRDQEGHVHVAHVKTSMFSGVYLTNDQIVKTAEAQEPVPPSDSRTGDDSRNPGNGGHMEAGGYSGEPAMSNNAEALAEENRHLRQVIQDLKAKKD